MGNIEQTKTLAEAAAFLRQARLDRGWTAQDLASKVEEVARSQGEELSLTQQAVSFFETGKTKSVPRWLRHVNLVFMIDDVEKRSVGAFVGDGEGLGFANDDDVEIDSIDLAYGMGGTFVDDNQVEVQKATFSRTWLRQFTDTAPDHLFSTQGAGDSMFPTIHDRDVLIIDRSQRTLVDQLSDKVWAIMFGEIGMIKRLRPMPDGTVKILSDNSSIPPEVATDGDLFIVGRVVAKVSRL